jgi:RNA-binding protein YlmH
MVKEIYQHFREEEKESIVKFNTKFEIASRDYYPVLLDFLDPREKTMVESIAGFFPDITVQFYGGGGERERVRAMLIPEMMQVTRDDFEITILEIEYPEKFVTLTHRNVLGAIMNVGLARHVIGDIVIGDKIQLAIEQPYSKVFKDELTHIKNAPVKLKEVNPETFIDPVDDAETMIILSSSFRLDTVISEVLNEGRAKSKSRITKGKVKVNHRIVTSPSFLIEEHDVVSVRHFGRFQLDSLIAETRKGKYRLQMKVYKSK